MVFVAYLSGTPVFDVWLMVPINVYGIDVYGYVVNPIGGHASWTSMPGYKISVAVFPVDVTMAYFFSCIHDQCTEPIVVGLDVPSRVVYLTLVGVKP